MLTFSGCLSIFSLIQLAFLLLMAWILWQIAYFCFIHFWWFSLAASFERNSSVFSVCLSFSISMKLDETVTCGSLEGYVGASLCSLRVPSGFGGRTGFDVNTRHIFHRMSYQGLALCSLAITAILGVGLCPKSLEEKFLGLDLSWFSFKYMLFLLLAPAPSPQRGWLGRAGAWIVLVWPKSRIQSAWPVQ